MNLFTRTLMAMVVFILMAVGIQPGQAQQADETAACRSLVLNALLQVGNNCADLDRRSACYGFNQITSILDDAADNTLQPLSEPSDQIAITDVAVIDAVALNLKESLWGIAPTSVEANLPVALPGRDLVLIPLGDVEVENGVEPSEALLLPEAALPVKVAAATKLILEPETSNETVGEVAAGTTLEADGISPDGKWLRVYFEHEREYSLRATAWVAIESLETQPDTSTLPVIGPDSFTPMQKFYLRNAFTTPACKTTIPRPLLFVQGPKDIETDFIVNGAKIRISSVITLRLVPPGDIMEVAVLSGIATLNPDTASPLIIPAGFETYICLSEPRNLGIDDEENDREVIPGCTWGTPRPFNRDELAIMAVLQEIPANVINYRFTLPRLVCPSGVGKPICKIVISDPRLLEILRILCGRGLLPPWLCQLIGGL
ncbi:MAG TPA: hypothetical protein VHO69_14135 [Phototrophicaceae bacterium]|nr:hypothetical protein [Phototrophicaceae bacterium]